MDLTEKQIEKVLNDYKKHLLNSSDFNDIFKN